MPLHDWTNRTEWFGMHHFWTCEVARSLRAVLPPGYRSLLDAERYMADELPQDDLAVRVEQDGRPVAAVELISRRYTNLPSARGRFTGRYVGYLRTGLHLLLVDIHPRPAGFSFAQMIAGELGAGQPAPSSPAAASYRGRPATAPGQRPRLDVWQYELVVGQPLPTMPLAIAQDVFVPVDLEGTYSRAAVDAYVE